MDLKPTGIWTGALRAADPAEAADALAELEALGYGTVWLPGFFGEPAHAPLDALLAATRTIVVATGILSVWGYDAAEIAAMTHRLNTDHDGRFLLGLGVSHAVLVDQADAGRSRKPLTKMRRFLDELDVAEHHIPEEQLVLAALKPKMTALAAERTAGAHPYLAPVAHTARAREQLGTGKLLAPELGAVLETDRAEARRIARGHLEMYLGLPNYVEHWRDLGYGDEDVTGPGSDRLVDDLIAWGDEAAILARIEEHRAAGADHVCLQVLHDGPGLPRAQWRRLAAAVVA
jgi:probable F420-dependent oxidoreductase